MKRVLLVLLPVVCSLVACERTPPADVLIVGANVYTLTWPDPDREGRPAPGAPHDALGWHRLASLAMMDIDPFRIGEKDPARLLAGKIVRTIVGGRVARQ